MRIHASALILAAGWLAAACTSATVKDSLGRSSHEKASSGSGSRPSEEGEGVVGYLTDPTRVVMRQDGDNVTITGPKGAVAVDRGAVGGLTVCIQQVGSDLLQTLLGRLAGFGGDGVMTLARGAVAADGSFKLSVKSSALDPAKLLAVNVTGTCANATSVLEVANTSLIFKELMGDMPFSTVAGLFPDRAETTTAPFHFCAKASATCTGRLDLDVQDAATGLTVKEVTLTFFHDVCPTILDPCTSVRVGSLTSEGHRTIYWSGSPTRVGVKAKGYVAVDEPLDAGPPGPILMDSAAD